MDCWNKLPEKFLQRLNDLIPADQLASVQQSYCLTKPLTIRINTLKTDKQSLINELKSQGIETSEVEGIESALIVKSDTALQLTELECYDHGLFYIQNLSSMLPSIVLDPKPGETVLDLAAAPGSKTTHLAQMMENTGEIIANDVSRQRLFKLKAIINQLGVTNVKKMQIPGEFIWKKYPNYFDKVLVDAPCTMEGRFNPDKYESFKDWSTKKIKVLSHLQKRLLKSAFYATKPGGIIVYSTCTLSPEENEEVVDWLVNEEKEHISIEEVNISIKHDNPLSKWKTKTYGDEIKKTFRIFPSLTMEGFFVAKLKRIT